MAQRYDLILRNGRVIDGAGNPWFAADVGIRRGHIVAVGDLSQAAARQVIDVKGQVIAPGFIDVHTHVEGAIEPRSGAENFLFDGVTSIITGNCGDSQTDLKTYFETLKNQGISINVASLIGHNSVRREVMGLDDRPPTAEELARMQALVARGMRDGAVGLSTGLIYLPGTFAETAEVVALAREAARYGGVYASHIRNEDHRVFDAIAEAVQIGREARIPVEISHFKITGKTSWGRSAEMIDLVNNFRREGIDVTVDQYPYTASSTGLSTQVPNWAQAGGVDSLRARLADPATKARIVSEMKEMMATAGFADYEYAAVANCPDEERFNGLRIPAVARAMGKADGLDGQIEAILELVARGPRVSMVYHKMAEEDVQRLMQFPLTMIASDAGIPEFGKSAPHPRAYGTNARVLGRYVRELGTITLEDAIRKMTSLPATRFHLSDRGLLRPGYAADIVVFDPAAVGDRATFDQPHAYASGFSYVLVNGVPVIENGRHTGKRPGGILLGPGR